MGLRDWFQRHDTTHDVLVADPAKCAEVGHVVEVAPSANPRKRRCARCGAVWYAKEA